MPTVSRSSRPWIAAVAVAVGLGRAMAEEPAGASPAAAVADGRPWIMITAEGAERRLTLYDDGTGRIDGGPVPLTSTWRATPDGFCLKPSLFVSERCLVLEAEPGGYLARRDGEPFFTLTR